MFHLGQQVVCIEGEVPHNLCKGQIYTISGMGPYLGVILLDLAEIKTKEPHAWLPSRFRPLKETSIAMFQEMLVKTPEMADV